MPVSASSGEDGATTGRTSAAADSSGTQSTAGHGSTSGADTGGASAGDSGGTIDVGGPCEQLLACARTGIVPVTPLEQVYGENGTCWDEFAATDCEIDCTAQINALHELEPALLECTLCVEETLGQLVCAQNELFECQAGGWEATWAPGDELCQPESDFAGSCSSTASTLEFQCYDGPGTPCETSSCADDGITLFFCVGGRTAEINCISWCEDHPDGPGEDGSCGGDTSKQFCECSAAGFP